MEKVNLSIMGIMILAHLFDLRIQAVLNIARYQKKLLPIDILRQFSVSNHPSKWDIFAN